MKFAFASLLVMTASVAAFAPAPRAAFVARPLRAEETAAAAAPPTPTRKEAALVPIKEETIEFTSGIIGGFAGLVIGGPVLALISAAAANYVSKGKGEVADVVQAVSKSSIQVYNYLAGLDAKYEVLNKATKSLQSSLDKLKESETVDKETVAKVEKALTDTKAKMAEINDEYDLVGGATTALGVVGDLVEKAIKKAGEINQEYKLSEKAGASLKTAVDKAKTAAKDVA